MLRVSTAAYPPAGHGGIQARDNSARGFLQPCCFNGDCILDTSSTPPNKSASATLDPATAPLLLNKASAARWRRKGGGLNNIDVDVNQGPGKTSHQRTASGLFVPVAGMEQVHGVDVSWLHKPNKEQHHRKPLRTQSSPDVKQDVRAASPKPSQSPATGKRTPVTPSLSDPSNLKVPSFPNVTPPTPVEPTKDTTNAYPSSPSPSKEQELKRPSLFGRPSAERVSQDATKSSKKSSWMNSFSSKFSSQTTPERPAPTPTQPPKQHPQSPPPTNGASSASEAVEEAEPYVPSKPKDSSSSFFSNLRRSLSSTSQTGIPKVQGTGGLCERRVLNVDPNRERCTVPEMDSNRLRRVSFYVDVEIAGGPRYHDDEDEEERKRKKKEIRMKEKAEGEALKNPEALKEEKDKEGEPESKTVSAPSNDSSGKAEDGDNGPPMDGTEEERDAAARKREKKKQSEVERKERKEKRRRRAEESGSIPVELSLDGAGEDAGAGLPTSETQQPVANGAPASNSPPVQPQPNTPPRQDRPTTDPVRIYRRCCQLRESPILKRITEQLMNPKCILPQEPGVVNCLDLTGSRLQLADVVTLGDWLAVVPVKQLKLEDADLSDEGIRCILAGLLAAKKPEPTKRRSVTPKHREGIPFTPHEERSGVVEKITLKNNPRMTRVGWKHISLFIYMCRSLRAIDLSMNEFPGTLPPSAHVTPIKSPQNTPPGRGEDLDAGEALYQCLAQRLAGAKLEELIMSECGLTAANVRYIVDGTVMSGTHRLGLAGNHLDDEGLAYVMRYLRSGMCQALDVGGNDLRGKLGMLGEAMTVNVNTDLPCWGLSLADCNLDTASLKPLFAQLVKLPSFRFIDLSHNRDLCSEDNSLISLLGRYIGQFQDLKRIHLADVNMSPKQAISLANVLPEGPRLAHLNLLENPQLTALANAETESDQEEACALYASLMAAVRVSGTLICIDIDVPGPENSEVVKALAKQVVAYSLRNMEEFAIADATADYTSTANATAALTRPHGGEKGVKEFTVPDVLMHLVGHMDGVAENHDQDEPAPDEDYIVGGTGVVKALQYVLGEKAANDSRGTSTPTGTLTPKERLGSAAGLVEPGRAIKTSKDLLGSARKIRDRLQPALLKEATTGNEVAYRRLLFLDQTLQSIIERFEEEYPETRLSPPSQKQNLSAQSSFTDQSNLATSVNTQATDLSASLTDEEEVMSGEEDTVIQPEPIRHNSDVNIASRAQTMEEGRLHRIGQAMRREVIDSPARAEFTDVPWQKDDEDERFKRFGEQIENTSGVDLKKLVTEEGWYNAMTKLGGTYVDLRQLQEQDPEAWELFKEAQEKARLNMQDTT